MRIGNRTTRLRAGLCCLGFIVGLLAAAPALAIPAETTFDFEGLGLDEVVTDQFIADGITFDNAVTLIAGISLNAGDFPPTSGSNVISGNAGGPLVISFVNEAKEVAFEITTGGLTQVVVLDGLGAVLQVDLVAENLGSTTHYSLISSSTNIGSIEVSSLATGDAFFLILDDVAYAVPEPTSFVALACGLVPIAAAVRRRRRR